MKKFECSNTALSVMQKGNILGVDETPEAMFERIVSDIGLIEIDIFGTNERDSQLFQKTILDMLFRKDIVPSTPIMTNMGRIRNYPLSACVVPEVDLEGDFSILKEKIDQLHLEGMGTGFNFTGLENPIGVIYFLNKIADELQNSGEQNRPVGNMGIMSVYDKHIFDFIKLKQRGIKDGINRKFNFSVDIDDNFINSLRNDGDITLSDGKRIKSQYIFNLISEHIYISADPGIVRLDKMNDNNPLKKTERYIATAPCGEVGLSEGEACQFSSINLGNCITEKRGFKEVDYLKLTTITKNLIRFLDDALEYSIGQYSDEKIRKTMQIKRKIGVGVCGFADLLIKLRVPYDSKIAQDLASDIMATINFESKIESIKLAQKRGSFLGFEKSDLGKNFYSKIYGNNKSRISNKQRKRLDYMISKYGIRHVSTTALPPTGRSSIVFDVSQQIEPLFNLKNYDGNIREDLLECLSSGCDKEKIVNEIKKSGSCQSENFKDVRVFKTSTEIRPHDHLKILESFQKFVDESVSKTINLSKLSTIDDIKSILEHAFDSSLKGITIYRDGSRGEQPINLS